MSTADDIKLARTPQEALLLLATAIDELRASIPAAAPDAWGQALNWHAVAGDGYSKVTHEPAAEGFEEARAASVAAIREQLATATGEEREALEAQLRLLRDTARNVMSEPPQGKRVAVTSDGSTGEVAVVPVSPERMATRATWAKDRQLHTFCPLLTEAEAIENYAKGGPMWLYLSNREAVMSMPYEWRIELVKEVALDSDVDAQQLSADILKSIASTDLVLAEESAARLLDGR